MKFGMEVGLSSGYIVLDGDPAPLLKKGHSPQFSANFYCGQTAGYIKMPLGMEVGLGPGRIVLDGDPVPPQMAGDRKVCVKFLKACGRPRSRALFYCAGIDNWDVLVNWCSIQSLAGLQN